MSKRDEYIALRDQGHTYQQIALKYGVTKGAVSSRIATKPKGGKRGRRKGESQASEETIKAYGVAAAMAEMGFTYTQIQKVLGVDKKTAWRYIKKGREMRAEKSK